MTTHNPSHSTGFWCPDDPAILAYWRELAARLDYDIYITAPPLALKYVVLQQKIAPLAPHPVGKGLLIWQLEACEGGDPVRIADRAAATGLQWLAVKIHDGRAPFNGDLAPLHRELVEAHVELWGWGYCYGADPVGEGAIAAARVNDFDLRGYLLDGEHQLKANPAAAAPLCERLRADMPQKPLGLCSYRYPLLHGQFPWATILPYCTFHAPQLYWLEATSDTAPALQLAKSQAQLSALRALPFVPIGCASPNDAGTWWSSPAQVANFHAATKAAGCPGVGYWSWQHAARKPELWAEIANPW